MQAPALAAEQPSGDGLAGERMAEREHVGRLLDDETAVDERAQRVEQTVLARAR